jgi:hypothetical protein
MGYAGDPISKKKERKKKKSGVRMELWSSIFAWSGGELERAAEKIILWANISFRLYKVR